MSIYLRSTAAPGGARYLRSTVGPDVEAPSGHAIAFSQPVINRAGMASVVITYTGAEVGASYALTITGANGGTPVTRSGIIPLANGLFSGINISGIADGPITASLVLTDAAGNAAPPVTASASKDATPPVIIAPPPLTVTLINTDSAPHSTPEIVAALAQFSATDNIAPPSPPITTDFGTLPDPLPRGDYTVTATATDAAGNVATAQWLLTVYKVPPSLLQRRYSSGGVDATSGQHLGGTDHLRQSIKDILVTPIGSRVMRREYGSNLFYLVDAPMNRGTMLDIYAATAEALARWEPRFQLQRVQIEAASPGAVTLSLTGIYVPTGEGIVVGGIQVSR